MTAKVVTLKQKKPKLTDDKKALHEQAVSKRVELFCNIIMTLENHDLQAVSEASGVSYACLYNWMYGTTVSPLLSNAIKVADALGLEICLSEKVTHQRKRK